MALLNEINVKGVPHPIVTDDGYYQEMTVGDAEQLVATTFTEDDAPYNFRTAGGAIDIGDRKQVEGIVGGTIAWNQLLRNPNTSGGLTFTTDADGTITINGTTTGSWAACFGEQKVYSNHVYLLQNSVVANPNNLSFRVSALNVAALKCDLGAAMVYKIGTAPGYNAFGIDGFSTGTVFDGTKIKCSCFDLTQMFGVAIADHINSLEQSNAGAGVAWFRKLFPKMRYAFTLGQFQSVKALRHKTVGFNAWDEEWELGTLPNPSSTTQIRSKNYIRVVPNTPYFWKAPVSNGMGFYDANFNRIEFNPPSSYGYATANSTFIVPEKACYMKFWLPADYGTVYKGDICINLHWDGERDGEYEEYVEHVYELDPDLELRGIPKLSAGNDLYYDGDVYEPDGTVTRKYGTVDLGTLTWYKITNPNTGIAYFYALISEMVSGSDLAQTLLSTGKYTRMSSPAPTDKMYSIGWSYIGGKSLVVRDDSISTEGDFKSSVSGVYLVYELATPTTEEADPYNGTQIVDDFGTEEFVDAGVEAETREVSIPVGHNSLYQPNLRAKLEMVPEAPEDEGYYVVYHHDGINEYVPLIIPQELPELPSEDGTYTLKCTVASGSATLSFESEV